MLWLNFLNTLWKFFSIFFLSQMDKNCFCRHCKRIIINSMDVVRIYNNNKNEIQKKCTPLFLCFWHLCDCLSYLSCSFFSFLLLYFCYFFCMLYKFTMQHIIFHFLLYWYSETIVLFHIVDVNATKKMRV